MKKTINSGNADLKKSATLENGNLTGNGEITPCINSLNDFNMKESVFELNIDFAGTKESEPVRKSNQPALERVLQLANNDYYFYVRPRNSRKGEAYLWITATKQGEDREEFALYVNDEILNVMVAILRKKAIDASGIDTDDLGNFNERISNFEYTLFRTEKAQGKTMKKTYTTNGQVFSSYYKRGVINYTPYLNPELKFFLKA